MATGASRGSRLIGSRGAVAGHLRRPVDPGGSLSAATLVLGWIAVAHRSLLAFLTALALSGIGLAVASVASTAAGTSEAGEADSGLVGGLLNAAAQLGTAVGIAVLLTVADHATAYLLAAGIALLAAACTAAASRCG